MKDHDLYKRQEELNLETPDKATVIGVGGVGSWTALNLALAGVQKLYLVDHDQIEEHNLNRTPFKQSQVGMDKTAALTELISERRMDAEIIPITDRIEDTAGTFREEMSESTVVDCRDHATPLPEDITPRITAGYDGYKFTLHTNPNYENIWGEENTEYETVPSFVAPPQFVSSIITVIVSSPPLKDGEEHYQTQDMREMIQALFDGGDD